VTNDEIIAGLRVIRDRRPVEIAVALDEMLGDRPLTESDVVLFFKQAFPEVPLRTLRDAGAWHRVMETGGLSDEEFDSLLASWLGPGT
jgi:hypothetical protein